MGLIGGLCFGRVCFGRVVLGMWFMGGQRRGEGGRPRLSMRSAVGHATPAWGFSHSAGCRSRAWRCQEIMASIKPLGYYSGPHNKWPPGPRQWPLLCVSVACCDVDFVFWLNLQVKVWLQVVPTTGCDRQPAAVLSSACSRLLAWCIASPWHQAGGYVDCGASGPLWFFSRSHVELNQNTAYYAGGAQQQLFSSCSFGGLGGVAGRRLGLRFRLMQNPPCTVRILLSEVNA